MWRGWKYDVIADAQRVTIEECARRVRTLSQRKRYEGVPHDVLIAVVPHYHGARFSGVLRTVRLMSSAPRLPGARRRRWPSSSKAPPRACSSLPTCMTPRVTPTSR